MTAPQEKPLPCPFCGKKPQISDWEGTWYVDCVNPKCPANDVSATAPLVIAAIRRWNTRAGSPARKEP